MSRKAMALVAGGAGALAVGLIALIAFAQLNMSTRRDRAREHAERARTLELEHRERALAAEREANRAEAVAVFGEPTRPTPEDAAEFAAVFDALGGALARGDADAARGAFDVDRMLDELERCGAFERLPGGNKPGFRDGLRKGAEARLGSALVANPSARWDRTEVRHVRWSADRRAAVVIAVHHADDTADVPMRFRWWLAGDRGGWRLYDFEDMHTGLQLTRVMAAMMTPEIVERITRDPLATQAAVAGFQQALALIAKGDVAGADRALAPVRQAPGWPAPMQALVELAEGSILLGRDDAAGALARFEACERLLPGTPAGALARGNAYVALGRAEEALEAVRAYRKEVGPDALSSTIEGGALASQGKRAEAAAAFRRALDEVPASVDALDGLRRVLPAAQKGELGDRLAKLKDPRKAYEVLAAGARQDDDDAAADVLLDAFRKARPDDTLGLSDDIRRKVKADKFADAAALLRTALKAPNPDDREAVLDAYLFAMSGADRPLDAYKAVPAAHARSAFRTLAEELDPEGDEDADAEAVAKGVRQLAELVKAHRAREPNDPWAWFFEAAVLRHEKEYEKAEKLLAAGAAKLPKAADGDQQAEFAADRFRGARVECLFKLKKAMTAYRAVGPVAATFRQLADLFDRADDLTGLAELLAEHRKREPNDDEWVYWQAHLHFRKDNYGAAIPMFKSYLRSAGETALRRWQSRDELLRALVRTKPADARKAAKDAGPQGVSAALQAAIAAAVGDRAELERLLAEGARGGKTWFYSDPDFRRFIEQEEYRDLRAKYPDPNPPKKTEG